MSIWFLPSLLHSPGCLRSHTQEPPVPKSHALLVPGARWPLIHQRRQTISVCPSPLHPVLRILFLGARKKKNVLGRPKMINVYTTTCLLEKSYSLLTHWSSSHCFCCLVSIHSCLHYAMQNVTHARCACQCVRLENLWLKIMLLISHCKSNWEQCSLANL